MKKIPPFNDHREIILLWGPRRAYAEAIGVREATAQSHYDRNSIGEAHLQKVVDAAAQIGHPEITISLLWSLKPRRRRLQSRPLEVAANAA
jgi:hypothetical protein